MHQRVRQLLMETIADRMAQIPAGDTAMHPGRSVAIPRNEAENALRALMIRILPRLRRGGDLEPELRACATRIASILPATGRHDLRYLDALNRVYETYAEIELTERQRRDFYLPFLGQYRAALSRCLDELGTDQVDRPVR